MADPAVTPSRLTGAALMGEPRRRLTGVHAVHPMSLDGDPGEPLAQQRDLGLAQVPGRPGGQRGGQCDRQRGRRRPAAGGVAAGLIGGLVGNGDGGEDGLTGPR
jgi:hypothetical protein